jgi:hypothetical protein
MTNLAIRLKQFMYRVPRKEDSAPKEEVIILELWTASRSQGPLSTRWCMSSHDILILHSELLDPDWIVL